ncbi:MAG: peroxide stress protein YaaA [Chlorobi bacterium]|nr:peroxide stress protein YaaA [Chlorobiota bacterium]
MHIIISPAKTLNFDLPEEIKACSFPPFLKESKNIVNSLKKYNTNELMQLMSISFKLADLNKYRIMSWNLPFSIENTKPAMFVFNGDVYTGLGAKLFSENEINYAQSHLSILSGLYGILKPMDGIQAYRLEMGTKLQIGKTKNLYKFWGDKITIGLLNNMKEANDTALINLASLEYSKAINFNKVKHRVITPVFKDFKNGNYKTISIFAKKARGLMTKYIIKNSLKLVDDLKLFDYEGYSYNDKLSEGDKWVFTRD